MIVQWSGGGRLSMFVGHKVVLAKWSKEAKRCKNNTMHGAYTAARINKDIQRYEDAVNKIMQDYDAAPKAADVKTAILAVLRKDVLPADNGRDFFRDLSQFIIEQSKVKSWSEHTAYGFNAVRKTLMKYNRHLTYDDLSTPEHLDEFVTWLQDMNFKSSSIKTYIDHINWYLRWAETKGYIKRAPRYTPVVKKAPKKIIFLTKPELMAVYSHPFDNVVKRRARDFFCFCCFTGLRYSDAYALKTTNIVDDTISIISQKDIDNLHIELNKYSREILSRVELTDEERKNGYALPHFFSTQLNRTLKEVAKESGLNEIVNLVYYKGGTRHTEQKMKWQVISSHTGRKTFICTALSQGISPTIVMKWTGHSDYQAMKPYIDIIDEEKKKAMRVFDTL